MALSTLELEPGAGDYPPALGMLPSPPRVYLRGALPEGPAVAVVGTREPSDAALAFTGELVRALVASRVTIWSGGAHGIDAAAHRAALEAGGRTVVVLGGGLDRPYPADHVALFDEILARGGACLARVPNLAPPTPPGFLARNTLLAALTGVTVVVQAGFKSGARSTAAAARKLDRPLFVVPHPPWDPSGVGCALELARGARALANVDQILEVLGLPLVGTGGRSVPCPRPVAPIRRAPPPSEPLSPDETEVLGAVTGEPVHLDLICERAGLPLPRAAAALLTLSLKAVVVEGPAGSYRRASSSLSTA